METYIYKIVPYKENFMETITEEEEKIVGEHFEYLKKAHENGIVLLAGPCLDAAFGIVIFKSNNFEEAKLFMENDPAVKRGVFEAELHDFKISIGNLI
ncbi:YciI family protein [Caloramator mitchellensis]|nr:YciI family protein [Caloramator mitchellensis]